jgi:hypothetical protein
MSSFKRKMKKIYSILFSIILTSCIKVKEKDREPPQINFTEPAANSHYNRFDTILFNAVITDNNSLKSVYLTIIDSVYYANPLIGSLAISKIDIPVNTLTDNYGLGYLASISHKTVWKCFFTAEDNNGNKAVKESRITIN